MNYFLRAAHCFPRVSKEVFFFFPPFFAIFWSADLLFFWRNENGVLRRNTQVFARPKKRV